MENFMSNNSKKIRILMYLWIKNFTHFSVHLSVKLSRNSRENLGTFGWKIKSAIPGLTANLCSQIWPKKLFVGYRFLETHKILSTNWALNFQIFPDINCDFCCVCPKQNGVSNCEKVFRDHRFFKTILFLLRSTLTTERYVLERRHVTTGLLQNVIEQFPKLQNASRVFLSLSSP